MYKILNKTILNEKSRILEIEAKNIARNCLPGQFIILRVNELHERLPFTIFNNTINSISIVYQIVGVGTTLLDKLNIGDYILDVVGPLGKPTDISNIKKALVIGGGVGCAVALPVVRAMYEQGIDVTSIIGFRNKEFVILEKEFSLYSSDLYIMTDDGSYQNKGFVTEKLIELLKNNQFDKVFAIGPLPMMKNVSLITNKYNIPTIVSMNPIMIDGTGMCGGCRVIVNGEPKFACVDGPDFVGHLVDFDIAIYRNKTYLDIERNDYEHICNLVRS